MLMMIIIITIIIIIITTTMMIIIEVHDVAGKITLLLYIKNLLSITEQAR